MFDKPVHVPTPARLLQQRNASAAFLEAWKTLRKRWIWTVTLATAVVVAVGFYTAGRPRIYRASCTLQIDPTPPRPLGADVQAIVDVGSGNFWAAQNYYNTQFKIMRSRAVAEETARRLGLQHNSSFLSGREPEPGQGAGAPVPTGEGSIEQAAAIIGSRLFVEPIRDSRLVEVAYQDSNPERARQILATLVSVYVDRNIDVALESTNTAAEWLEGQVQNLKTELEGSETVLQEYKKGNRILSVSLEDQSNMVRQEMQQLSAALTSVRVRRAQVAANAEELAQVAPPDGGVDLSNSDLLRDEVLQRLRQTLEEAVAEHESLLGSGKAANHPLVASANARVLAAREALQNEAQNVRQGALRELAVVDREVTNLSRLSEQAHERALELGALELDYRRLERNKTNTEKLYSLVIEKSKESNLTRMMRFNNIQIIDPPLASGGPVSPRVPFNMTMGLLGGLALGLLGAFAREMFDQSVKSPTDIEQELGMTLLGLLPRIGRSNGAGYGGKRREGRRRRPKGNEPVRIELIVHEDPTSAISEASRALRTNLSFMSPDKAYHTLLVTSAGPGEGKTTVACCLAIAMAQAGQRVLLVDCDLRRPRLHRVFDRVNDRGVTSCLLDRASLKAAVQETEVPGLSVLLSGPACPNPAESLQSNSFQSLLADMAVSYDRVVLDSPPVGAVTDAVILSTRVDASVLVIRAMRTSREAVRHARRALHDVRANLVGAILNVADPHREGYPYYHGHYNAPDADKAVRAPS
jgi:capsular exopolysaccharide synthesis family protein